MDVQARIEVEAAHLRAVLKRMAKLGRAPGPGTWSIGDGLRIAWMGMSDVVEGEALGAAIGVVDGKLMRGLARGSGTWNGTIVVDLSPDGLRVGSMVIEADRPAVEPPQLLPLNAGPADVLRLHVGESPERLAEAGLEEAVGEVLERLQKSSEQAARHLGWLGVGPEEIEDWILQRYRPRAAEHAVFVEPTGQTRMFD